MIGALRLFLVSVRYAMKSEKINIFEVGRERRIKRM